MHRWLLELNEGYFGFSWQPKLRYDKFILNEFETLSQLKVHPKSVQSKSMRRVQ